MYPYRSTSYKHLYTVPIVLAMTAYEDPTTGESFILVLNDCLYHGNQLNNSLYNTNHLLYHGTLVWDKPYDNHHELRIEFTNNISITPQLDGNKTYFDSITTTQEELRYCVHVELKNTQLWETSTVDRMLQYIRSVMNPCKLKIHKQVSSVSISHRVEDRYDYS